MILGKDRLIFNSQDEYCRNWLSQNLPPSAWGEVVLLDYYRNDEYTLRELDALRSQNIHYSGGILFVTVFQNPTRPQEKHIGTLANPIDWAFYLNERNLRLAYALVDYVCPEYERVKQFKDAICMDSRINSRACSVLLAAQTLNQLEGLYAKLVREKVIDLAEQKILENIPESAGVIISLKKTELVCVER